MRISGPFRRYRYQKRMRWHECPRSDETVTKFPDQFTGKGDCHRRLVHQRELLAVGLLGRDSRIGKRIESLLGGHTSSPRTSLRRVSIGVTALSVLAVAGTRLP